MRGQHDAEALLLFEDTDVVRRRAVVEKRVGLIATGEFLRELEAAGLIQSTDRILDEAAKRGRNVDRQRRSVSKSSNLEKVRRQLRRREAES